MSEFSNKLRQEVDRARAEAKRVEDERSAHMEQEEDRDARSKQRAKELLDQIPARMSEAAEASDGAMAYRGAAMAGIGANAFDLAWEAPPPQRMLRVVVNYFDGVIHWSWLPERTGGTPTSALDFDMRELDDLIMQLARQDRWAR